MASRYADLSRDHLERNHVTNPRTGRRIKINGSTHKKLVRDGLIIPSPQRFADHHPTAALVSPRAIMQRRALRGFAKTYNISIVSPDSVIDQLHKARTVTQQTLTDELGEMRGIRLITTLKVLFRREESENTRYATPYFNSRAIAITNEAMVDDAITTQNNTIQERVDMWLGEGSGWVIDTVEGHWLNLNRYTPLRGGSYIQLPENLRHPMKGIINIKNEDNECFRWCHLAHKFPALRNADRVAHYRPHIGELDYTNVTFPVKVKDYKKIEHQNGISINVFGYEGEQIYPIYVSKEVHSIPDTMDLLLITDSVPDSVLDISRTSRTTRTYVKQHYCLIKDFNRLMFSQTKHANKKHFCRYCLQCFSSQDVLESHKSICLEINGKQAVKMPNKGSTVKFTNFRKQLDAPFVIYADFEALTEPEKGHANTKQKSYTHKYQKHTVCGYGYKVVCCYDDRYSRPVQIFRSRKNVVYKFLQAMMKESEYCARVKRDLFNKDMVLTAADRKDFAGATHCHICKQLLNEKPVRDHCHVTGKYRGAAHNKCNLDYQLTDKIPVIFHNLRGYDGHMLVQEMGKFVKENHIRYTKKGEQVDKEMGVTVIPNNMEKYMAIMLGDILEFKDSFQFMNQSLDKLSSNLKDFPHLQKRHPKQWRLLSKKGVYPYDYMSSWDRFAETSLPPKKQFYSMLSDADISDSDYQHAEKVWAEYNIQNMGEYHDLYLESDVLILADVFESFRKTCNQYYSLDPAHYFTAPGLAWDAALKMTDVKLDLLTDVDMYQFIEKGMRGGVSYIANRYNKANNKYTQFPDASPTLDTSRGEYL